MFPYVLGLFMSGYQSTFRPFSKGVATENLTPGSRTLSITLAELFPAQSGEITSRYDTHQTTGQSAEGTSYASSSKTSSSIVAEWLPFGSNRITAPNVRRNEAVLVWATADHGEYRWTALGDHDNYRNTEIVVYGFRAAKDYSQTPSQTDSMYCVEINTERGLVAFSTTTARDEYTRTAMVWDTAEGTWAYEDGVKNKIMSEAKSNKIVISNSYGSEFGIQQGRAWIAAPIQVSIISPFTQISGTLSVGGGTSSSSYNIPAAPWQSPDK